MITGPVSTAPGAARRRRTAGIGAVAVAAALLTSSCAAGRHAQTPNQIPSQDGVNATVGAIALRGLAVKTPSGSAYYLPGSAAAVRLVLVNTGQSTDLLTNVTSPSVSGWGAYSSVAAGQQVQSNASASVAGATAAPAAGSAAAPTPTGNVSIPAGSRVSYGVPDSTGSLLLTGTKGKLYPGSTVRLTFTFARSGTVTVAVPIQLSTTPGDETVEAPAGSADSG